MEQQAVGSQRTTDADSGTLRIRREFIVILCLMLPSFSWIVRDRAVWPWDQAWYGQVSTDLWFSLGHSARAWMVNMLDGMNIKPPGICWVGQFFLPFRGLLGSVEAALLLSILLTQAVVLVLVYRTGAKLFPEDSRIPLLGMIFSAGGQLFVGLSHQMFVEPLQAAAVAWICYIAANAAEWSRSRIALNLGAAGVLGLAAKATTPLYCAIVGAYSVYRLIRSSPPAPDGLESKTGRLWLMLVGFAPVALVTAAWYLRHWKDAWQHIRDSSSGEVALAYGARDTVFNKLLVWWKLLLQSFTSPYLCWVFLGCLAIAVVYAAVRRKRGGRFESLRLATVLSAAQIALMLLVFASNITVDSRYMFALSPFLAILFMQLCAYLPPRVLPALLLAVVAQCVSVNAVALGMGLPLRERSEWLKPFQDDSTRYTELTRVVQSTDEDGRYSIVGVEEPWLNANSASFFASKQTLDTGAPRGYYTSLGYAQRDTTEAIRRIGQFATRFVITLDESQMSDAPNFLNVVSRSVLEQMKSDPRFARRSFTSRTGITIFQFRPDSLPSSATSSATPGLDATAAPTVIARAQPKTIGKSSLGWVNGKEAIVVDGARIFTVPGGVLRSCLGWAFDDRANTTPAAVWLELTDTSTRRKYYWKAKRYSRPELGQALNLTTIPMAGMECRESLQLPSGRYSTQVYQAEGESVIVSKLSTYEQSPFIVVP